MKNELTLVKAVVVNRKDSLGLEFIDSYYPEIDMYVFFSETIFDLSDFSHKGKLLLHDRLIAEFNIPKLSDELINYVTVDIKKDDKTHTYLSFNRRFYQLNQSQIDFLMKMFNVDYCKSQLKTS